MQVCVWLAGWLAASLRRGLLAMCWPAGCAAAPRSAASARSQLREAGCRAVSSNQPCCCCCCRCRSARRAHAVCSRLRAPPSRLAAKLENDTETFEHERVSSELKKQIQSARLAKKLTQAQASSSGSQLGQGWAGCRVAARRSDASHLHAISLLRLVPHPAVCCLPSRRVCAAGSDDQREAAADQRVRERQGDTQPAGARWLLAGGGGSTHRRHAALPRAELVARASCSIGLPSPPIVWFADDVPPSLRLPPQILGKMSRVLGVTLKKNPGKK